MNDFETQVLEYAEQYLRSAELEIEPVVQDGYLLLCRGAGKKGDYNIERSLNQQLIERFGINEDEQESLRRSKESLDSCRIVNYTVYDLQLHEQGGITYNRRGVPMRNWRRELDESLARGDNSVMEEMLDDMKRRGQRMMDLLDENAKIEEELKRYMSGG